MWKRALGSCVAIVASASAALPQIRIVGNPDQVNSFGEVVACAGDVNGDQHDDVVVGSSWGNGQAFLISGADGSVLRSWSGAANLDRFGFDVDGGRDINVDGTPDVVVGAHGADVNFSGGGSVFVFSGLDGSVLHAVHGGSSNAFLGSAVAMLDDFDGDGRPDFAALEAGRARVYSGLDAAVLFSAPLVVATGGRLADAGDVDGDGMSELIVGLPLEPIVGLVRGTATVYDQDGSVLISLASDETNGYVGDAVAGAGDVDMDGFDDVLVAAPNVAFGGGRRFEAYALSGLDGSVLHTVFAEPVTNGISGGLAGVGDFNGDGYADFAVGLPFDQTVGSMSGRVNVYSGIDGAVLLSSDGWPADRLGATVAGGGDFDNDGIPDIAAGTQPGGYFVMISPPGFAALRSSFCASPAAGTPCPCGEGLPGHGCELPQGTGGVRLDVTGYAVTGNRIALRGTGFPAMGNPAVVAIRSTAAESVPAVFGDGLRCISSTGLVRVGSTLAEGGVSTQQLAHNLGVGTWFYQLWFRSQPMTFCDGTAAFNLSNGAQVTFP